MRKLLAKWWAWFCDFAAHARHRATCSPKDGIIECGEGEVRIRCMNCGLRSPGLSPGPLRVTRALPGDPLRHRAARSVVSPSDGLIEVEVEAFEQFEERIVRPSGRVH